jgi:urease accessory protein
MAEDRLPRATAIAGRGHPFDTVTLTHDDRHRRRIRLTTDGGTAFLLDLAETHHLADGHLLVLDDGRFLQIRAAPEPVLEVEAATPIELARLAWHLGNRHTPVQVLADGRLRLRDDHVLAAMLKGLGASVTPCTAPFSPEHGAYAGSGHDH